MVSSKSIFRVTRSIVVVIATLSLGSCTQKYNKEYIFLAQGWQKSESQRFWFTSQGSQLVPYDLFLALEQAGSQKLFRDDENIERLRYIPAKKSELNPDELPIGFVKDLDNHDGSAWLGFTCAACHTSRINYRGDRFLIEGGPTMADYSGFVNDLIAAMQATAGDAEKFDRSVKRIFGENPDPDRVASFRNSLTKSLERLVERAELNEPAVVYGFGRLDAFGNIFNQVTAHDLGVAGNKKAPGAPVSYPYLWDVPQSDRVQWNGLASNVGIGPLSRNVGEALGVFGRIRLEPDASAANKGYASSAKIEKLRRIEGWLENLWSPAWPRGFPDIDAGKRADGADHFEVNCIGCHHGIDRTSPGRKVKITQVALRRIGTDQAMALNALGMGDTGKLEGILGGDRVPFKARELKLKIVANAVIGSILNQPFPGMMEKFGESAAEPAFDMRGYKARPLNGVWASAPYLHNGSVANLWELLKAPDKRAKSFYVGSQEFDPVHVGFVSEPSTGTFELDTTLAGNFNSGHVYGTKLLDDEKWDLIEYLKSL